LDSKDCSKGYLLSLHQAVWLLPTCTLQPEACQRLELASQLLTADLTHFPHITPAA